MVNVQKLQDVLDTLVSDLSKWDQGNWISNRNSSPDYYSNKPVVAKIECGTAFCVAGEALVRNGHTFVGWSDQRVFEHVVKDEHVAAFVEGKDVPLWAAHERGAEVLELTDDQANALFWSGNSMAHIFALVNLFTRGQILIPESLPAHGANAATPNFREEVLDIDADALYDSLINEW